MPEQHQVLGKYEIIDVLGQGGFATVYRAHDKALDRDVAIKVLAPLLMRNPEWVRRFQREARAVAKFKHPHIIRVLEIDQFEGVLYIAMELAEAGSLDAYIKKQGNLSWNETLRLAEEIADALDYAHEKGILHLDLKPANILLDPSMGVLLSDFGFARMLSENSLSYSIASKSGGIIGTPFYMAPELWKEEPLVTQTDIYAFGCIVFEMITGQRRFSGRTSPVIMRAHFEPPPFPDHWPADVPHGVKDVLARAMNMDVNQRFVTARDMVSALQKLDFGPVEETTPPVAASMTLNSEAEKSPASKPSTDEHLGATTSIDQEDQRPTHIPSPHIAFTPNPQEPCVLPKIEVTLPPYPDSVKIPSNPMKNPLYYGGVAVIVLIALGFALAATAEMALLAIVLAGGVVTAFVVMLKTKDNELAQRHRNEVERRHRDYLRRLEIIRKDLDSQRSAYQNCLLRRNPAPAECLRALETQNFSQLWTRSPAHHDFLDIRIGMGAKSFSANIHIPAENAEITDNQLIQASHSLQKDFQNFSDIPLTLSLKSYPSIGLIGSEQTTSEFLNAIVTQIAMHHTPRQVKFIMMRPEFMSSNWGWMRWLPHVWSDDRQKRYIATDATDLDALIHEIMRQPDNKSKHYVFLSADASMEWRPQIQNFLNGGAGFRATGVFLIDSPAHWPGGKNATIDLRDNTVSFMIDNQKRILYETLKPDRFAMNSADRLARMMAPFRLKTKEASSELPSHLKTSPSDSIFQVTLDGEKVALRIMKENNLDEK